MAKIIKFSQRKMRDKNITRIPFLRLYNGMSFELSNFFEINSYDPNEFSEITIEIEDTKNTEVEEYLDEIDYILGSYNEENLLMSMINFHNAIKYSYNDFLNKAILNEEYEKAFIISIQTLNIFLFLDSKYGLLESHDFLAIIVDGFERVLNKAPSTIKDSIYKFLITASQKTKSIQPKSAFIRIIMGLEKDDDNKDEVLRLLISLLGKLDEVDIDVETARLLEDIGFEIISIMKEKGSISELTKLMKRHQSILEFRKELIENNQMSDSEIFHEAEDFLQDGGHLSQATLEKFYKLAKKNSKESLKFALEYMLNRPDFEEFNEDYLEEYLSLLNEEERIEFLDFIFLNRTNLSKKDYGKLALKYSNENGMYLNLLTNYIEEMDEEFIEWFVKKDLNVLFFKISHEIELELDGLKEKPENNKNEDTDIENKELENRNIEKNKKKRSNHNKESYRKLIDSLELVLGDKDDFKKSYKKKMNEEVSLFLKRLIEQYPRKKKLHEAINEFMEENKL